MRMLKLNRLAAQRTTMAAVEGVARARRLLGLWGLAASLALAVCPNPAVAAPATGRAPSATTDGAAQVTGTEATLRGTVDPRGNEVSCYFQYGATAAYGAQTPTVAVGSGATPVKVSQPIAGLQLGTTYHYRLVAMTAGGAFVAGADRVLTTKKLPLKLKAAKLLAPVTYGSRFKIEGSLSGTGAGGVPIVLQASPFPYIASFVTIAGPIASAPTGGFSFLAPGLKQNTELRVATLQTPPLTSAVIAVRVAVKVTLHAHTTGRAGYVRLYGTVTPAVLGAPVTFQVLRPGLAPLTIGGTVVGRGTSRSARFRSLIYVRHGRGGRARALVKVTNGRLVSGYSTTVTVRAAPAPVRKARRVRAPRHHRR